MQSKKLYAIVVVFLLLIPTIAGLAQTPFLKQIPLFRGKENYNVNVVYQDSVGWIWFGTDKGLFKYDGINFFRFTMSDSLADNNITAIGPGNKGMLWIGHKNGKISCYEKNLISIFRPEEGLGTVEITDIISDQGGNIWYSTLGEGIFKYNGRHLSNINADDGLSDNYVYDLEYDSAGTLWLATDYGITSFSEKGSKIISMKDGLPDNIVRVLKAGTDGRIWLGSEEAGVSIYNPADSSITDIEGWHYGAITGFAMNLENELWISTRRNGIIKLVFSDDESRPSYHQMTEEQGLISREIHSIVKDYESNIWIAGNKGVVQALPPVFEFLNKSTGTPFEMVYSFSIDREGSYWICSELGLYKAENNDGILHWINISEKAGLQNINFISIYTAPDGSIWTGTYGSGVFRFSAKGYSYKNYTQADGLLDNNVIHISGSKEHLWFSTLGGGVSHFDTRNNKISNFNNEELNQSYVYSAVEDKRGRLWIAGSMKSPAFISDGKVGFITDSSTNFPQLYGIAIDSANHTWFNTHDHGLLCVREDTIISFGAEHGIDITEIQSIVFDKWDNLVLISNQGIEFFTPEGGVIMEYGENTGLAYKYPILNSVFTDEQDQIWIGSETGIIKYNPDYLAKVNGDPRIYLSTIELFGNPVDTTKTKYRHNENNFTFGYTGFWYKNPEGLKIRYKLKGYDLDWIYSRSNQPLTYSKLPPGTYRFEAEASLNDIKWVSYGTSAYAFEIKPPFWQRWWFMVTVIIFLIAGVLTYIRQRLSNLKKAKEELEKEVHRRTEEIRMQNEELETQKEEIEAQRDNAEQQRDRIEQQNEEIQASIRYAHRIQSAALPPKSYLDNILGDHFILNKPRDIVSGDFYWVAKREDTIFFAVGDCTGHGVPGAFMSMLGLTALNDIVKSLEICKASEILDLLNEKIVEALHQGPEKNNTSSDGMDISLCIYDPSTGHLQFAAAQNDMYIINSEEIKIVKADSMGIGAYMEQKKHFKNNEIKLRDGDKLYLFSDGFPDQFGGPQGKKYKYKPFREFLLKIQGEDMCRQRELLDEEIENWRSGIPQIDDIIVMGFKQERKKQEGR